MIDTRFRALDRNTGQWHVLTLAELMNGETSAWCDIDEETIGQFTGKKDCNGKGKDIYAGDVVELTGYGEYVCEFPFQNLYTAMADGEVEEIVDNIHENPELTRRGTG